MTDLTSYLRRAMRQIFILIGLVGITFAAGVNWAEAATGQPGGAALNELHIVLLFLATIAMMLHLLIKPQRRERIRARARADRKIRR